MLVESVWDKGPGFGIPRGMLCGQDAEGNGGGGVL